MSAVIVRNADVSDAPELCRLIRELAEYEKMSDVCSATPEGIREMMSEPNGLGGIIAEKDGIVSFNDLVENVYSIYRLATFSGKRVFYIEDIFVEEAERGSGIGKLLFDKINETAKALDCIKIEWKCLGWNSSAQAFYAKQGGVSDDGWLTYTIDLRKG